MTGRVVVVGAGIGGLTAAIRLAQRGVEVVVLEARNAPGGLACDSVFDGLTFDSGPYILLDRPGLAWAFARLDLDLDALVPLRRIEHVYEVATPRGTRVRFHADLALTSDGFERQWPGSGSRYRAFVAEMRAIHARLQPLLQVSRPGLRQLIAAGGWRHLRFLLSSLGAVLRRSGLPGDLCQAIAIWTHVAGQSVEQAPSPLAFVPALIHDPGAFYPTGGIGSIIAALRTAAVQRGVQLRHGARVASIRTSGSAVAGVELVGGEVIASSTVLSNAHGVGTYVRLVADMPATARERLTRLPLQSPGICIYLAVQPLKGSETDPSYLHFDLPGGDRLCRLLVRPGALSSMASRDGWQPARLIAPMRHAEAEALGDNGQRRLADQLIGETWWHPHVGAHRVLHVRTPSGWGAEFGLYRDSMNPVMTAAFMRAGRLAHRSPFVRGLHLAGSSTHPGQWLSFCAISGILSADQLVDGARC
ncbi:MAG: NAD(P)/FAD-dependent oxidoreductase [Planctomycetes bacterium]|nr:NAD(P)/FAD-dependent oxidoreductase [Planctomycetota bacterium]